MYEETDPIVHCERGVLALSFRNDATGVDAIFGLEKTNADARCGLRSLAHSDSCQSRGIGGYLGGRPQSALLRFCDAGVI